jgi:hypothetical protein
VLVGLRLLLDLELPFAGPSVQLGGDILELLKRGPLPCYQRIFDVFVQVLVELGREGRVVEVCVLAVGGKSGDVLSDGGVTLFEVLKCCLGV